MIIRDGRQLAQTRPRAQVCNYFFSYNLFNTNVNRT
jgi:hypothetical protein